MTVTGVLSASRPCPYMTSVKFAESFGHLECDGRPTQTLNGPAEGPVNIACDEVVLSTGKSACSTLAPLRSGSLAYSRCVSLNPPGTRTQ